MGDRCRMFYASDNVQLPKLFMHVAKHSALATVLDILLNDFEHVAHSIPYGIYSVDQGVRGSLSRAMMGELQLCLDKRVSRWTSVADLLLTNPGSTRSGSRAGTEVQCLVFAFIDAWLQG